MTSNQETKNASTIKEEIYIDRLNDDCLLEIFKNLTEAEKLEASFVCTRWAFFLAKNLHITDQLLNEINEKTEALPFLITFIKTCGSYVNSLKIKGSKIGDGTTWILKEAANNCKNIMRLELRERNSFGFDFDLNFDDIDLDELESDDDDDFEEDKKESKFNEDIVEKLFENNVNLRSISLYDFKLTISGKCLLKLQPNNIEEFVASSCKFASKNCFVEFLAGLKNVEKLATSLIEFEEDKINVDSSAMQNEAVMNPIEALNKSNCKSITELIWCTKLEFDEVNDLMDLLLKQKNLKKLKLQIQVKVDEKFLDCVFKDHLEFLELDSGENVKNYSFHNFQNLKVLHLSNLAITDKFLKELTECKNLKDLHLCAVKNYLLTASGEGYFGELESLESFKISVDKNNIDNILIALSKCKNLKSLDISVCHFTGIGLKSLYTLPMLINLDVASTKITNKQFKELVKKLPNLTKINVSYCDNVSEEVIEEIKAKSNRQDSQHVLKVIYEPDAYYGDDYDSDFSFSNNFFPDEDFFDDYVFGYKNGYPLYDYDSDNDNFGFY